MTEKHEEHSQGLLNPALNFNGFYTKSLVLWWCNVNILNKRCLSMFRFFSTTARNKGKLKNINMELIMANSNLVFLSEDKTTPLTSTVIIANALKRDVREINQLIKKYQQRIEGFGTMIILNDRCVKTYNGGYKTINDYYLNEMQATFVITLMRNSPKVLDFKVALVKAFFEMRNQLQNGIEKKWTEAEVTQECKEIQSLAYSLGYAKGVESVKAHYKEKEKEWEAEKEKWEKEKEEEGQESYNMGYDRGYDEGGIEGFNNGYDVRDRKQSLSRDDFDRLVSVYSQMTKQFYNCGIYVEEISGILNVLNNVKKTLTDMSREPALERLFILDKLQNIQKEHEKSEEKKAKYNL